MARMTGFIFQDRYEKRLENLSDQEVGRLVRALVAYHARGETQELKGREQGAYDFIRADIDDDEARHEEKCKTYKQNQSGRKRTKGNNGQPLITIDDNGSQSLPNDINGTQNSIEVDVVVPKEYSESNEDMPFGLTEKEIHDTLEADRQIEQEAIYCGMDTSMANLDKARALAREYGLHPLLAAMRESTGAKDKWRYTKAVLKKGGMSAKAPALPNGEAPEDVNWL